MYKTEDIEREYYELHDYLKNGLKLSIKRNENPIDFAIDYITKIESDRRKNSIVKSFKLQKEYKYICVENNIISIELLGEMIAPFMVKAGENCIEIHENGYKIDCVECGKWIMKHPHDEYDIFNSENEILEQYT